LARTAAEWLSALEKRRKRLEKDWLKDARDTLDVYDGGDKVPFNILFSNTETLLPTLYNSTPRPEVARRYTQPKQSDRALDGAVAQCAERTLEYLSDSNDGEYETFDDAVKGAVMEALVPGQGQIRVRYRVDEGYQAIYFEQVAYDRFLWGYARKWQDVPWVAFGHDLDKAGVEKQFPKFAKTKAFKDIDWTGLQEREGGDGHGVEEEQRKEPTILVWEVHDGKEISYVCDVVREEFLLQEAPEFQLTTKWPCLEPLKIVKRSNNLTPKPPYLFYKSPGG
jgi:hypothetical protein